MGTRQMLRPNLSDILILLVIFGPPPHTHSWLVEDKCPNKVKTDKYFYPCGDIGHPVSPVSKFG